jgi:hypothetical protein
MSHVPSDLSFRRGAHLSSSIPVRSEDRVWGSYRGLRPAQSISKCRALIGPPTTLGILEVGGVEALGEPVADIGEPRPTSSRRPCFATGIGIVRASSEFQESL